MVMRWAILFSILLAPLTALATVYHYVDERGRKIYVDRVSEVPQQYRGQLEVRAQPSSSSVAAKPVLPDDAADLTPEQQRAQLIDYMSQLETSVVIVNNSVMVPVDVTYGGRTLTLDLILDTGASSTVIYDHAIALFNQPKRPAGRVQVADGATLNTHTVDFSSLAVGPHTISSPSVVVIEHKGVSRHDGLLGMDFLRQAKHEVDFDRGLIIWQPEYYLQAKEQLEALDRAAQQAPAAENN